MTNSDTTPQPIVIGDVVTLDDGRKIRANTAAMAAYLEQERRHVVAIEHGKAVVG